MKEIEKMDKGNIPNTPTDIYGREVDISREKTIWEKFINKYSGYDQAKILKIVKNSVDKLTRLMFNGDSQAFIANRQEYGEIVAGQGELSADDYFEGNFNGGGIKSPLLRVIAEDENNIKIMQELFKDNQNLREGFVQDIAEIITDTKMKVFIFKYLNDNN